MAGFSSRLREKIESTRSNAANGHVPSSNQPKNIRGLTRLDGSSVSAKAAAAPSGGLLSGRSNTAGGAHAGGGSAAGNSIPPPVQSASLRKENEGQDASLSAIHRPPPHRSSSLGNGKGAPTTTALGGSKIVPGWGAGSSSDASNVPSGHLGGIKLRDNPAPRESKRWPGGEGSAPPSQPAPSSGKRVPWALHQPSSPPASLSQPSMAKRRWGDEEEEDSDEDFPQIGNKAPAPAPTVTSVGENSCERHRGDRVDGGRPDTGINWRSASSSDVGWREKRTNSYSSSHEDRFFRPRARGNFDDVKDHQNEPGRINYNFRDSGDYGGRRHSDNYYNEGGYRPRDSSHGHVYRDRESSTRSGSYERGLYGDDRWGKPRRGLYDRRDYHDDTNESRWGAHSQYIGRRENGGNVPNSRMDDGDGGKNYSWRGSGYADRNGDLRSQSKGPDEAKQAEVGRNGIDSSVGLLVRSKPKSEKDPDNSSIKGGPEAQVPRASDNRSMSQQSPDVSSIKEEPGTQVPRASDNRSISQQNPDNSSIKEESEVQVARASGNRSTLQRNPDNSIEVPGSSAPKPVNRSMFEQNIKSDDSTPMLLLRSNKIDSTDEAKNGQESSVVSAEASHAAEKPDSARRVSFAATLLDKIETHDAPQPPPVWSSKPVTSAAQVSAPTLLTSSVGTNKEASDSSVTTGEPSSSSNLHPMLQSSPAPNQVKEEQVSKDPKDLAMEQQQNVLRQVAERRAAERRAAERRAKRESSPKKSSGIEWERGRKLSTDGDDGKKAVKAVESSPEKSDDTKWERGKKLSSTGEDQKKSELLVRGGDRSSKGCDLNLKERTVNTKESANVESVESNTESRKKSREEEHIHESTESLNTHKSDANGHKVREMKAKPKGEKRNPCRIEGHEHDWNDCPNNPKSKSFIRNNPCRIEGHEHDWIDCPDNPKSDSYVKPSSRRGRKGTKSQSSRSTEKRKHGSMVPSTGAEKRSVNSENSVKQKTRGSTSTEDNMCEENATELTEGLRTNDSDSPAELPTESSEPVGKKPKPSEPVGKKPKSSEPAGKKPKSSEPVGKKPKSSEPVGKKPKSSEPVGKKPKPSESLDKRPKSSEALDNKPKSSEALDKKPKSSEALDKKPKSPEALDKKPKSSEPLDKKPKSTRPKPFIPAPAPAVSAWMSGPPPAITQHCLPPSTMPTLEITQPSKPTTLPSPDSVSNQLPPSVEQATQAVGAPSQALHHAHQNKSPYPPTQKNELKPILFTSDGLFPGNHVLFGESLGSAAVYDSWNPPPMVLASTYVDPWKPNPFAPTTVTFPSSGAQFGSIWSDCSGSLATSKKNDFAWPDNGALRNGELLFIGPIPSDVVERSSSPAFSFNSFAIDDNCSNAERSSREMSSVGHIRGTESGFVMDEPFNNDAVSAIINSVDQCTIHERERPQHGSSFVVSTDHVVPFGSNPTSEPVNKMSNRINEHDAGEEKVDASTNSALAKKKNPLSKGNDKRRSTRAPKKQG